MGYATQAVEFFSSEYRGALLVASCSASSLTEYVRGAADSKRNKAHWRPSCRESGWRAVVVTDSFGVRMPIIIRSLSDTEH